jgi:hypothetical protein
MTLLIGGSVIFSKSLFVKVRCQGDVCLRSFEKIFDFAMQQSMPPLERIAFDSPCPFEPLVENFSTKSLTENDKEWLGAQLYYEKITSLDLSKKDGVPASTLRTYKSKIVKQNIFKIRAGRPPLLDEIAKDSVVSELTGGEYQTTGAVFPTILQEKARQSSKRRGSKCTLFVRPSKRSIIRYMKQIQEKRQELLRQGGI